MSAAASTPSTLQRARQRAARATRRSAAVAAAVTALILLAPMLAQGPLFGLDLTFTDLGTFCAVKHALADGLGLWLSPWLGNGSPLALQPAAQLFYPVRWLFLLLPVDWGNALHQAAHLVAGAAATAWLARSFRARPGVSMAAGIAFALGGPALDLVRHAHYAVAAAWLPLVWVAGRTCLRQGTGQGRARVWLALALTALLLGGEPQAFAIAVALLVVESGWRVATARRRPWRALLGLVAALLVALALSSILLLPLQAELALARRGAPLPLANLLQWSFDASLWPAALLPGALFRDGLWSLVRDDQLEPLWNPAPYLGGLFVLLAVLGLRVRRARSAAVVTALGLVAALGDSTPLWPWLVQVAPGLDWFRFPIKYLVVTSLAASLCAALALQRMRRDPRALRFTALLSSIVLGALLGVVALLEPVAAPVDALADSARALATSTGTAFHQELQLAALRAALPLLAGVALWRWRAIGAVRALALCWALDVGTAALTSLRAGPTLSDLRSPLAGLPDAVVCHSSDLYRASLDAPGSVPGWGQAALHRLVGLPELQACDRIAAAVPYSPLASRVAHALYFTPPVLGGAVARAFGCSHVVAGTPLDDAQLTQVPWPAHGASLPEPGPVLHAVADPIPAATLIAGAQRVDEAQLLALLPRTTGAATALALVDDPLQRLPAGHQGTFGQGQAEILELAWTSSTRATVRLRGQGPVLLVLRRSFLAGWSATVGARPAPVLRAAGAHLAIVVDDAHEAVVQLRYRPPLLAPAMALCLAGLLGLGGLWWSAPRRAKVGVRRSGECAR